VIAIERWVYQVYYILVEFCFSISKQTGQFWFLG
jgi:hypothetical protein